MSSGGGTIMCHIDRHAPNFSTYSYQGNAILTLSPVYRQMSSMHFIMNTRTLILVESWQSVLGLFSPLQETSLRR
jgi:hypothetical protein